MICCCICHEHGAPWLFLDPLNPHPAAAGFRSTRRTKLIATIGPACDSEEMLEALAVGGMNVA
jgi:hypothetical protein